MFHRWLPNGQCARSGGDFASRVLAMVASLSFFLIGNQGHSALLPAASPALVESGMPAFVVMGPEALGLSSAPTDLHLLSDGRLMVVSNREIAFGDGVRWQVFHSADDQAGVITDKVAVAEDGQIYAGIEGNIARVDFGIDGRWSLSPVVALPPNVGVRTAVLKNVLMLSDTWYWHGGTGAIMAWKPGQTARIVGKVGSIETIFSTYN